MKRIAFFFLLVNVLLIPLVLAVPYGEDIGTIDTGQPVSGNVSLPASTVYYPDGTACTAASQCAGGYCNSGVCASSAPAAAPTPSVGGVTVTEPTAPAVVEVTKTIATASPTAPAVAVIEADKAKDLKVDQVTVEVKETVSNVQVTVKDSSLPTGANLAVSTDVGTTYKYIDVTTNVQVAKIEKVKIKFKVEKTWVNNNNIASATVALQRYADNKWNKLATSMLSEDTNYFYYEAESPGLSVFAVTGEKKAAVQQACPSDCCIGETAYLDKTCPTGYECKNRTCVAITPPPCPTCPQPSAWSDCIDEKQTRTAYRCSADTNYVCQSYSETQDCPPINWKAILFVAVLILAVAVIVYWFFVKRR